jgi:Ser/Thr protein kinase RdoA (MazF antagonist)
MLHSNLLHTILCAYDLEQPTSIKQIHNGTNQVYRFDYPAGSPYQKLAVKISTLGSERSISSKQAEIFLLDRIRPKFPCVPKLITPNTESTHTTNYPWGLLWNNAFLISVYHWVPSVPYRGLDQQLIHVGKSFVALQKTLSLVKVSELPPHLRQPAHQRFKLSGNKIVLDDNFTFTVFNSFIKTHASRSRPCFLFQNNISFLENEIEEFRKLTENQNQILDAKILSLVHLELSPSNFGFNEDHTVAVIYDFDSLNYGLPLQDTGWLCATFCFDYRSSLHQVTKDLTTLLSSIQSQLATDPNWRDLLLPFMRLGYLDAIYRKLLRAYDGVDTRMGFVKEDILCLRWLRQHDQQLTSHIQQISTK